jgi:phosphatidate cytidylyltransferase
MKRILTALVLIPLVLFLVFLGPRWQWLFTLAVAAVAALAAWEYLGLVERSGAKPPRVAVVVALGLLFAGNFEYPDQIAAIFGGLSLGLLIYCTFRSSIDHLLADAATSIFCLLYVGLTLLALPNLREETNGPSLVAFLLCVVWAGDIAALYVGRLWAGSSWRPRSAPTKPGRVRWVRWQAACWQLGVCWAWPTGWRSGTRPSSPTPKTFGIGWGWLCL